MNWIANVENSDLHSVLRALFYAGCSGVRAERIAWTPDMTPALNRALTMQYIVYKETRGGRVFSLTHAAYQVLGEEPPAYMTLSGTMKAALGFR